MSQRSAPTGSVWVVTIGDELLAGDITDTNLTFLAQHCRRAGATVVRAVSVRDRLEEIAAVVREAVAAGADACLVSGGLGPTTDDVTTAGIAVAAGVALQRDGDALTRLQEKFRAFGIATMPPANTKQADFPEGAQILPNPIGTAEGFSLRIGGCLVCSMPGVPRELRKMTTEQVLPRLAQAYSLREVPRRIYQVLGHGESAVAERIAALVDAARARSPGLAAMYVHYRASTPRVTVILEAVADERGAAATTEELATLDDAMIDALAPGIFGIGEADLATRVLAASREAELSIAVAESCTGGSVGAMISTIAGASASFLGGVIAYDNRVKQALLQVPQSELDEHGAVSEPVARSMAAGGRKLTGADLCVAITGIAGPDGGTPDKPLGTVHICVCDASETTHKHLKLRGDRGTVQRAAAQWALKLVWDRLVTRGFARVAAL